MDLYFSWAFFFKSFTRRFKWAAEVLQFKMVPVNIRGAAFNISWGVILLNECAAVQILCSQTGLQTRISQFKGSSFGPWCATVAAGVHSPDLHLAQWPWHGLVLHTEPWLCVNPCHKNPSLFSCGSFSSEMEEKSICFQNNLKWRKQRNNLIPAPGRCTCFQIGPVLWYSWV